MKSKYIIFALVSMSALVLVVNGITIFGVIVALTGSYACGSIRN